MFVTYLYISLFFFALVHFYDATRDDKTTYERLTGGFIQRGSGCADNKPAPTDETRSSNKKDCFCCSGTDGPCKKRAMVQILVELGKSQSEAETEVKDRLKAKPKDLMSVYNAFMEQYSPEK